jgi:hypothetical protein
VRQAREVFDQICAAGSPADEFAYAGLINCYRHMSPVSAVRCSAVGCNGLGEEWADSAQASSSCRGQGSRPFSARQPLHFVLSRANLKLT